MERTKEKDNEESRTGATREAIDNKPTDEIGRSQVKEAMSASEWQKYHEKRTEHINSNLEHMVAAQATVQKKKQRHRKAEQP